MEETWRDAPGYEGFYQVSNLGKIKSVGRTDSNGRYRNPKILKQIYKSTGYLRVQLCFGAPKTISVHTLVAKAFPEVCGKWFDGCEVDHINGIRDDNRAENLKVVTHRDNCNNPITKRCYIKRGVNLGRKVDQFSLDGEKITTWNSAKEIERELGYNESSIRKCCKGTLKKSCGYIWKYAS